MSESGREDNAVAAGARRPGADTPDAETSGPATRTRIYRGELTSAISALLLLALMFGAKWYGVAGVPDPSAARPAVSTAENAWNGLTDVRWLMLATIAVVFGSVVLHASQRTHGTRTDTSRVLLAFGAVTSLVLFYRVLIALPEPSKVIDQKLGAVLGLLCALGIALGGLESIGEQRRLARAVSEHPRHRRGAGDGTDLSEPPVALVETLRPGAVPTEGTDRAHRRISSSS